MTVAHSSKSGALASAAARWVRGGLVADAALRCAPWGLSAVAADSAGASLTACVAIAVVGGGFALAAAARDAALRAAATEALGDRAPKCTWRHMLDLQHGGIATALRAATEADRRFASVIDSAQVSVVIFDAAGRVCSTNRAFDVLRARHAEVFASEIDARDAAAPDLALFEGLRERVLAGQSGAGPARFVRLDSASCTLQARISMFLGPDGGRAGYYAEFYDVTQEVMLEERVSRLIESFKSGDVYSRIALDIDEDTVRNQFLLTVAKDLNRLLDVVAELFADMEGAVSALVAGDVTFKLTGEYKGDFEALKVSINQSMETFEGVVLRISCVAGDIERVTGRLEATSEGLTGATSVQRGAVDQATASIDHLSASIRETAINAAGAAEQSAEASRRAERGRTLIEETSAAMREIAESTSRIGDITRLIDAIAFQTNLLALNASVEAARAGEAGRGFAVVAQEVRALATRSADAARTIQGLIEESRARVGLGETLFRQSKDALHAMTEAVSATTERVRAISAATGAQAARVDDLVGSVAAMGDATTGTGDSVDANRNTAAELSDAVSALKDVVGFFIVSSAAEAISRDEAA